MQPRLRAALSPSIALLQGGQSPLSLPGVSTYLFFVTTDHCNPNSDKCTKFFKLETEKSHKQKNQVTSAHNDLAECCKNPVEKYTKDFRIGYDR